MQNHIIQNTNNNTSTLSGGGFTSNNDITSTDLQIALDYNIFSKKAALEDQSTYDLERQMTKSPNAPRTAYKTNTHLKSKMSGGVQRPQSQNITTIESVDDTNDQSTVIIEKKQIMLEKQIPITLHRFKHLMNPD